MPVPSNVNAQRAVDRSVPLRRGLVPIVGTLAAVVLAATAVLGLTVRDLRAAQDDAQDRLLPAVAGAQRLQDLFVNQETGERGYVITGEPAFLQPYRTASDQLPRIEQDLRGRVRSVPGATAALDRVVVAHRQWLTETVGPEIAAVTEGDLARARELVSRGSGRERFDTLRIADEELQQLLSDAQTRSNDRIRGLTNRLTWLLLATLLVLALLAAGLYPALQRLVVRPLQRFAAAAGQAGEDLSVPVAVTGPREVVSAAREVEGMRQRLVEQVRAARQAEQALAQRGPAVLALRAALAPTLVQPPGVQLASRLDPAEGFLAGDWFDAITLPGDRLGLVLGDVAGHGPEPAVFALRLKHLLSAALVAGGEPGAALSATARQVGETGELFATVFVAVVDTGADRITYANAGHPAALTVSAAGGPVPGRHDDPDRPAAEDAAGSAPGTAPGVVRAHLEATGPLLSSLTAALEWSTLSVDFHPGDLLLAYTDGLVEARDPAGEQYGSERLVQTMAASMRDTGRGPEDLVALLARVVDEVSRHAAGRAGDDITVVACRRT